MSRIALPPLLTALTFLIAMGGCDTQLNLNECEDAPSPPSHRAYLNLDAGTAAVDGPKDERLNPRGRLNLPARVDFSFSGERQGIVLGSPDGSLPQVEVGSLDPDTLEGGDEFFVTVGYNVNGTREGGPGRMRVTRVTPTSLEGTFAGCVRSENQAIPLSGPYRIVRGGFNATID